MRGTDDAARPRRLRPRVAVLFALATLTVAGLATMSAATLAYGDTVREGERLLPGTTIASVQVGEVAPDEAADLVAAALDERLDRQVSVVDGDASWTTTARDLGANTDLDAVITAAVDRAGELGFTELVRLRWLGGSDDLSSDVTLTVDADEVDAFVAGIAADVDRDPRDAEVAWVDDAVVVTVEGETGREVVRDDAATAVTTAVSGDADEVELPVAVTDPTVPTERATLVADEVGSVVDAVLDRTVTVTLEGRTETTSARQLGGVPTVDDAIATAMEGGPVDADDVDVTIPEGAIAPVLDTVTAGTTVPAKDAVLDTSGGQFRITPEVVGAAVDRADATERIRAALRGAADTVELELVPVRPAVTAASFERVLIVDASDTTLSLVMGGEVVRSWPVAVGTNNSPTPLGTFVVGAKRFEPTWVNPAKDRWGKDMPDRIGPGPDNPLGARAINWNRPGGGDTLIRFHGTPNEASIGSAASNGCVRMFNADVIELYDLIESGTTIISRA
jgi:lipoprotein-anchoring transpeptidase ErfK/SrfK